MTRAAFPAGVNAPAQYGECLAAKRWQACTEQIRDLLVHADGVKHLDETGLRSNGRTQWLHMLSTAGLAFYCTSERRGSLLEGLCGLLVHAHWAPYFTLQGVQHALCHAHYLRELGSVAHLDGAAWAGHLQQLLERANRVMHSVRQRAIPLPRSLLTHLQRRYDQCAGGGAGGVCVAAALAVRGDRNAARGTT